MNPVRFALWRRDVLTRARADFVSQMMMMGGGLLGGMMLGSALGGMGDNNGSYSEVRRARCIFCAPL